MGEPTFFYNKNVKSRTLRGNEIAVQVIGEFIQKECLGKSTLPQTNYFWLHHIKLGWKQMFLRYLIVAIEAELFGRMETSCFFYPRTAAVQMELACFEITQSLAKSETPKQLYAPVPIMHFLYFSAVKNNNLQPSNLIVT